MPDTTPTEATQPQPLPPAIERTEDDGDFTVTFAVIDTRTK